MGVDVSQAWDVVISEIAGKFPGFKVQAGEDADRDKLEIPAILIDLTELEPASESDATTGEWACLVHFVARVVIGYRTPQVRRTVARAAGALAAFVHGNRLGTAWGGGVVIAAGPDEFSPRADQVDIWSIEWVHQADLGDRIEVEDGDVPSEVFVSWVPEIGEAHVDDYDEITNAE